MTSEIISIATVAGALLTIWAFTAKIITPIKNILQKYENAIRASNEKLEKIETFISEHDKNRTVYEVEFARRKYALHYILRYILYEETARSKHNGYR